MADMATPCGVFACRAFWGTSRFPEWVMRARTANRIVRRKPRRRANRSLQGASSS